MKKSVKKVMNIRGIITEYLPWLIIGLGVLVIVMVAIFIFKDKGVSMIDQIKNIFRGR